MKFSKLRLHGFKSFVEATDFQIESGLTGIVGPNGCGKSNLVEALRWVMGENSYKAMRASGMDDVIFSGSLNRPSRNTAEVGLVLDNSDRSAPAAFNDQETIEVSRRIERESGSTFRINGREVRARDVQLLFADASSGARSPAMVRQGQIGEIIAAKPQARRRVLEEAAGVAGLHSRRHEAELRLKGAEDNVGRLDDVLKQIDSQIDSLKRQARQASRYKALSADIRRNQALHLYVSHRDADRLLGEAERKLEADTRLVADTTRAQAAAARDQAVAAEALPGLRDSEARAGAALHRLTVARENLDAEERRAKERVAELERRIAQLTQDLGREELLIEDANEVLDRLQGEDNSLAGAIEERAALEATAKDKLAAAQVELATAEADLGEAQAEFADIGARRTALERSLREEGQRLDRFIREHRTIGDELARLRAQPGGEDQIAALSAAIEAARAEQHIAEEAAIEAEAQHAKATERERQTRGPLSDAERRAQRLETEVRTLEKLLTTAHSDLWPPVVEAIEVHKGYEAALGAALGDDLDASTNPSAPAHWSVIGETPADPALPDGVAPLAGLVSAPPALTRRLAQIGVVLRHEGRPLQPLLKPGQRLVSKEGDLWRWDGFVAAAEAPTPAARRLAEKNRLGDLRANLQEARTIVDTCRAAADQVQNTLRQAAETESTAREAARAAGRRLDSAREALAEAERKRAQMVQKTAAFEEAQTRLAGSRREAEQALADSQAGLAGLVAVGQLSAKLEIARAAAAKWRAEAAEARASVQSLAREAEQRTHRRQAIAVERGSWVARQDKAKAQVIELGARLKTASGEREAFDESPAVFLPQRRALNNEMEAAELGLRAASDARLTAEAVLAEADRAARICADAMAAAREERARTETRLEANRQRRDAIVHAIAHDLGCTLATLAELAELPAGGSLPGIEEVERLVESLKADRDKLGAVNLRADDELVEVEGRRDDLVRERDDLIEAIRKLRLAIQSLNKEGRERLLAAFDVVNGHFQALFTTLFGGGAAELQLVESEDPLEAGLEIVARPPGKKPQTMTLLSGGEQALTALSLIFAVFLTNPSPICVLDEVDAPLDDANVERFCTLLDEMARRTDTRFVTITHNPITMARMDRLFGVTMAERGVSQLVSVDLQTAETFREAG
jgi:chromosome segregation protein